MIRLEDRCSPLTDLVEVRASLRRQETLLQGVLHDVQGELRCWNRHRQQEAAAGNPMPRELCILWDELESRERELALDLLQVRGAMQEANREIRRRLHPSRSRPLAS